MVLRIAALSFSLACSAFGRWPVREVPVASGLPYDCSWLPAQPAQSSCTPATPAVQAIAVAAELYPIATQAPPTAEQWKQMESSLDLMLKVMPDSLPFPERVFAQNAALRIAILVSSYQHAVTPSGKIEPEQPKGLLPKAAKVIAALALPASRMELPNGIPAPEIERWLGKPSGWIEKSINVKILFHENVYRLARIFRPIQAGKTRAIFSQLIGVDTEGKPRITPVIGEIELRRSLNPASPACVVALDPSGLACNGEAGLKPLDGKGFSHLGGYIQVNKGLTNCTSCHRSNGVLAFELSDVPASNKSAFLTGRRRDFIKELSKYLEPVMKSAR